MQFSNRTLLILDRKNGRGEKKFPVTAPLIWNIQTSSSSPCGNQRDTIEKE